jgi:hypothetical protein
MNHLLKAMGFWIWGLIAIGLSLTLVSVNYRAVSIFRSHDSVTSTLGSTTEFDPTIKHDSPSPTKDAKPQGRTISRIIAEEMTAAQRAIQAGQWSEAIKNLEAAEAKSPLTAFDKKCIYDFKGYAYVKLSDLKAAQTAYEAALATGAYTPEESAKTVRMLFRLAAGTQQYPQAIEYGKQLPDADTSASDDDKAVISARADDFAILSQVYFLSKNCKEAAVWADKSAAAFRRAEQAPKEITYQFKLQCASDAGDNLGMLNALYDLVRLTNNPKYWNTLLRLERQDERDDRNTLMLYRVMYDTAAMTAGSDYIEMAQLLGDSALPAEAQTVLEKAMSSGLINDQQKERTTRLLNSFKSRADADMRGLAQLDAEAKKDPAGELDVRLGEVDYGFGDYQNAVTAINRGLQKGQVKHLDDAYVYLGLSEAVLKDEAAAKDAFGKLKSVPGISPRILALWRLYAETHL